MGWTKIKSETDIQDLLNKCYGFHDYHLINLKFESGIKRLPDLSIQSFVGDNPDCKLKMLFQTSDNTISIELLFSGVRLLHLVGCQDRYDNEIMECYLGIAGNLFENNNAPFIVWSDNSDWVNETNIKDAIISNNALEEPSTSFVIANSLKWRIINK